MLRFDLNSVPYGCGRALAKLLEAGYHLRRFKKNKKGSLTDLSESHLKKAAQPIREIMAEIILTAATLPGAASVGAILKDRRITIFPLK